MKASHSPRKIFSVGLALVVLAACGEASPDTDEEAFDIATLAQALKVGNHFVEDVGNIAAIQGFACVALAGGEPQDLSLEGCEIHYSRDLCRPAQLEDGLHCVCECTVTETSGSGCGGLSIADIGIPLP